MPSTGPSGGAGALQGKLVISLAGGWDNSWLLTADGYVYAFGSNSNLQFGFSGARGTPTLIRSSIKKIFHGFSEASIMLLNDSDQIEACGKNNFGQLGLGDTSSRTSFTTMSASSLDNKTPVKIYQGYTSSQVLTSDGTLYGFGQNTRQSAAPGGANLASPVEVTNAFSGDIRDFVVGGTQAALITSNGTIYTIGNNNQGQLGNGNTTDSSIYVNPALNLGAVAQIEVEVNAPETSASILSISSFNMTWNSYDLSLEMIDAL